MGENLSVVGKGQLAEAFKVPNIGYVCIFASGVSNSNCQDPKEFERERNLLLKTLETHQDKKFVYFSSCALSAPEYPKNAYYEHKRQMEELIKVHSNNYYVFRIPQLFGALKHHKTLINFLYEAIVNEEPFKVYNQAYRYVIEIDDVQKLVEAYLQHHERRITVDLANPYRYKVTQIVEIFEKLLGKKALYELVEQEDKYTLDLSDMLEFVKQFGIETDFGEEYLLKKLTKKIVL